MPPPPVVSWRSRVVAPSSEGRSPGSGLRPLRRSDPPPKPTGERATFLGDVVAGLGRTPKVLPAQYMFDAVGARLFACLATADSHYLAKSELAILREHAGAIANAIGPAAQLVDLATGDGARTAVLAESLTAPARIVLADRTDGLATRAAMMLSAGDADLPILAVDDATPWTTHIPSFARAERTVAYLPNALIGELEPRDAKRELARLATECGPRGGLLVSVDLKKDPRELEAAYDDRAGVAASFGRNLLARINRELGGSFQLAAFDHRAVYDAGKGRVEMQSVSRRWQWAAVHGHWFNFTAAEVITTLVAYKYTIEWFTSLASSAGWNVEHVFTGEGHKTALVLLGH